MICKTCSNSCDKIGEKNNMGVTKSYCCACYFIIDEDYKTERWCKTCRYRVPTEKQYNKYWKRRKEK